MTDQTRPSFQAHRLRGDSIGPLPRPSGKPEERARLAAGVLSLALHGLALGLLALAWVRATPLRPMPAGVVPITLVDQPGAAPAAASPSPLKPETDAPPPPAVRPTPRPLPASPPEKRREVAAGRIDRTRADEVRSFERGPTASTGPAPGAAPAGLATATESEIQDCHVGQSLEAALRRNPRVLAAVIQARRPSSTFGNAIVIWNGDWVRSRDEDGKGLAAVREAISLQIVSESPKCLAQPMRGQILIAFGQAADDASLAIGGTAWRWSDLLAPP